MPYRSEKGGLRIQALSPDNGAVLRQIIRLYKETCAETFPIATVYKPDFWRLHIGTRFISLGVFEGNTLRAHVSLTPYPAMGYLQLQHLVVDAEQHSTSSDIAELIRNAVEYYCHVNALSSVFSFSTPFLFSPCQMYEKYLGFREVAFCPTVRFTPTTPRLPTSRYSPAILFYKRLNIETSAQSQIFLPWRHAEICKEIFAQNELRRSVEVLDSEARPSGLHQTAKPFPLPRRFQAETISPETLLHEPRRMAKTLRDLSARETKYILLDAKHPLSAVATNLLDSTEVVFCGIFPELQGSDWLVLYNPSAIDPLVQNAPLAYPSSLAHHLATYKDTVTFGEERVPRFSGALA